MAYVLDLSVQGITAGVLRCAVEAIRVSLAALAQRRNGTRVGVTMVDVRSHFLCLRGDRVCDVTLADYEEAFPPLAAEAWLTEVTESTLPRYWRLLDHVLRTASSSSTCTHSVLPAALKAVAATLKTTGGQILLVQTAPAIGEGVSPIRETVKVYGSTEEQALYAFPPSSFLETLTHLFLAGKLTLTAVVAGDPANFFHLAALETLVSDTGGRILFRPAGNSRSARRSSRRSTASCSWRRWRPIPAGCRRGCDCLPDCTCWLTTGETPPTSTPPPSSRGEWTTISPSSPSSTWTVT